MSYLRRTDERDERGEEADQVLQLQYERDNNWKLRTKALFVSFIVVIVLTVVIEFVVGGAKSSPFFLPIAPVLFTVTIGFWAIIILSMVFRAKDLSLLEKMGQRDYKLGSIKISQKGAIVHIIAALIFVVLFISVLPFVKPNWLQDMMVAGENYEVLSGRPHDLRFQGNDAFDATTLELDAEVTNGINVTFFLGEYEKLKDVDSFNLTGAHDVTLDGGYKENGTEFSFDGKDLSRDGYYILRIYNADEVENATMKITVTRTIKPELTYGMFAVALMYLFQGIGWFAFLTVLKRPSPAEVRPGPMARDRYGRPIPAAQAQDTRGLPPEAYYERGTAGPYGARGPPRAEGYGYGPGYGGPPPRGPPMERGAGRAPPAAVEFGQPARPARGPPPAAMAEAPASGRKGKLASIKCPRCKLQFAFERTGGPQTIKCPNCGKEGRIGAKKGAPPAAVAPAAAPARARPTAAPTPPPSPPARARPTAATEARRRKKGIRCPRCKQMFEIEERPRPFDIECPHCGKKGRLK